MFQPEISIEQGKLKGKIAKNLTGNSYLSFQGIPYAKPPIGNLRFKDPVAPEKWTGTFDATKEGDACYSFYHFNRDKIVGSENCLVLNVFTKQLKTARPVMVFIYGGGFYTGSSSEMDYSPEFLMLEDIVLVTFNYRVGIFGFLTLGEPTLEINGNAGCKDMIMALKWVQKNIIQFGGDKNNVTIFGQSSGGASVHALMLSPLAKGLFHKAIAQSGCILTPWAKGHNYSREILNILQENYNDHELLTVLYQKSLTELLEIQYKIIDNFIACELRPFGFVVDHTSKYPFLPDEPINIILSDDYNHVPLITGYTSSEGICFEYGKNANCNKSDTASIIPWELGYKYGSSESDAIAILIDQFYRKLEPNSSDSTISIMCKSDTLFVYPMYVMALKHVQTSNCPIYLYRVTIETELNVYKKMMDANKEAGMCHGDELGYLFKSDLLPEIKKGSLEELTIRRFVKLWTNFAKFGNPTPNENEDLFGNIQWKRVQDESFPVLDIGKELQMMKNPESKRILFWNGLYKHSPSKSKLVLS